MNIRLDLIRKFQRPVVYVSVNGIQHLALLDTGAQVPVFIGNSEMIARLGGRHIQSDGWFSGFGGRCSGAMYQIDMDMGGFVYQDLPVLQTDDMNMPFSFILSATMFSGFNYLIDDRHKVLTINTFEEAATRRLRAADSSGTIHVLAETEESRDGA